MSPRPASPHRARALELLQGGKTAAEVAAELGVSQRTVEDWARTLGRPVGKRGAGQGPRRDALPVIDLLLQGEPVSEIAGALERSPWAIRQIRARWLSDEPAE